MTRSSAEFDNVAKRLNNIVSKNSGDISGNAKARLFLNTLLAGDYKKALKFAEIVKEENLNYQGLAELLEVVHLMKRKKWTINDTTPSLAQRWWFWRNHSKIYQCLGIMFQIHNINIVLMF